MFPLFTHLSFCSENLFWKLFYISKAYIKKIYCKLVNTPQEGTVTQFMCFSVQNLTFEFPVSQTRFKPNLRLKCMFELF